MMKDFRSNAFFAITNFVTILNLVFGFLSILYSVNGEWINAALCIFYAAVFDALDGKVASYLKAYSDFGVEFDSICDVVSFGVAPSLLLLYYFEMNTSVWVMLFAGFPLFAGAIRLARFNSTLTSYDKRFFIGLPITSSALTIAAYILGIEKNMITFDDGMLKYIAYGMIVLLSFLMLSSIKYFVIPKFKKHGLIKFAALSIVIVALVTYYKWLLFPFLMVFILSGILRYLWFAITGKGRTS